MVQFQPGLRTSLHSQRAHNQRWWLCLVTGSQQSAKAPCSCRHPYAAAVTKLVRASSQGDQERACIAARELQLPEGASQTKFLASHGTSARCAVSTLPRPRDSAVHSAQPALAQVCLSRAGPGSHAASFAHDNLSSCRTAVTKDCELLSLDWQSTSEQSASRHIPACVQGRGQHDRLCGSRLVQEGGRQATRWPQADVVDLDILMLQAET